MSIPGLFYGFGIEAQNTNSLFRGFSIELEINLIITVVDSNSNPIDNSCEVMIYDSETDTLLTSGNTSNGIFSYFVGSPSALRIVANHPIEGTAIKSITHDGESVVRVTISFVPTVLKYFEANSLRTVIISGPQIAQKNITNSLLAELCDRDLTRVRYEEKVLKNVQLRIQFISSYELNTLKFYNAADDSEIGGELTALLVKDLSSSQVYNVYEFIMVFTGFPSGYYYYKTFHQDDLQGEAECQSEPIHVADSHNDTVSIEYTNNDNAFEVDYSSGIVHKIIVPGSFIRPFNESENDISIDSGNNRVLVYDELTRFINLRTKEIPYYLTERINIALAHDSITINSIECLGDQKISPSYIGNSLVSSDEVQVAQKSNPWINVYDK